MNAFRNSRSAIARPNTSGNNPPLRRRGVIALISSICGIGFLAVLLTGCALFGSDSHVYDKVDAAGQELQLDSMGTVLYKGHSGKGGFSQNPPALKVVFNGTDAFVELQNRLRAAGFDEVSETYWTRGQDSDALRVYLDQISAGGRYVTGDDSVGHNVDGPAVSIQISSPG